MKKPIQKFLERLKKRELTILDGATGTEIQRHGVYTALPLWSAWALISNPKIIQEIHKDYIKCGAQVIKTNTFRTNQRTILRAKRQKDDDRKLTYLAVELAKNALKETNTQDSVVIAGSQAPLEDCYSPHLAPDDATCLREHQRWSENLASAGVDCIWLETFNCIRETKAALKAATATGLPVAVSFVCNSKGDLISGEGLSDAVHQIKKYQPFAITINCMPPHLITNAINILKDITDLPFGGYGNGAGHPDNAQGWHFEGNNPIENYMNNVKKWINLGSVLVGGCCGTNPEYIKAISKLKK